MHEQLPRALWVMIESVPVRIGTDMGVDEKKFAVFHPGVTILQIRPPLSQGLDLCTREDDASLIDFFDKKIKPGLLVVADGFFAHSSSDLFLSSDPNPELSDLSMEIPAGDPDLFGRFGNVAAISNQSHENEVPFEL